MRRRREARETEFQLERRVETVARRAGLRVLRDLGDGGTSRVVLVVPLDTDPYGPLDAVRSALKVPRFEPQDGRQAREDRVLAAVRSPHIVALLGAPEPGTATLVLEYLPGGTLADLLVLRGFLRVGEAVTILISVLRALAALHAEGYAHGSLSASKIMFASDGRPVIVGLSHVVPVDRAFVASADVSARTDPDTDGFREIVRLLAGAAGDPALVPRAGDLAALAHSRLPVVTNPGEWERLEAEVFVVAPAEPVLLVAADARPAQPAGARLPRAAVAPSADAQASVPQERPIARVARLLRERLDGAALGGVLRRKRRLVLYTTGCLALAVVVVVLAVTQPQGTQPPAVSGGASPRPSAVAPESTSRTQETGAAETVAIEPTALDEPVDAGVRLLTARWACFSAATPVSVCLDPLLQPGSPIEQTDVADVHAGPSANAAEGRDYREYEVSLIERTGDAALLALTPPAGTATTERAGQTKPASLLIVRGEAGWRLRELFEN